jgi:hypothetical protein
VPQLTLLVVFDACDAFIRRLRGLARRMSNGPLHAPALYTSARALAARYQEADIPTIICGPGFIAQAH